MAVFARAPDRSRNSGAHDAVCCPLFLRRSPAVVLGNRLGRMLWIRPIDAGYRLQDLGREGSSLYRPMSPADGVPGLDVPTNEGVERHIGRAGEFARRLSR